METIVSAKVNALIEEMEANLEKTKGETYKFVADGQKRAVMVARKTLMTVIKSAKSLRKILIDMKKTMPVVKRPRKVSAKS